MDVPGIFRVGTPVKKVEGLKTAFDKGENPGLPNEPHSVAGLLKLWFRELKEPVLTFRLYRLWLSVGDVKDKNQRFEIIRLLIHILPRSHRTLLEYVIEFLYDVSLHAEKNNMDIANLATVFGPNLLRPKDGKKIEMDAVVAYQRVQIVIGDIILHHKEIFKVWGDNLYFHGHKTLKTQKTKNK